MEGHEEQEWRMARRRNRGAFPHGGASKWMGMGTGGGQLGHVCVRPAEGVSKFLDALRHWELD